MIYIFIQCIQINTLEEQRIEQAQVLNFETFSILILSEMATASNFYSKFGLKGLQSSTDSKGPEVCFLHNLIVSPTPYRGRQSLDQIGKQKADNQHYLYTNPKTSFYLCKKYQHSTEWERNPRFLMKRLAYRKTNTIDRWGRVIYNDAESKNYDQVATEFHCLNLLKGSHRVIQLISIIHQNTRSKEDKRFFYSNLKLPDRRSKDIKNICFILEEMSGGSLREQIDKVIITKEPFSEEKIIEYSCQFAEGLLELKAKGIIHRDLRPENVLIHNDQIKFGDFDSAFIKGYSDYRNIKNGVDMKETTPLQIMLLIAESEDNLRKLSSEELYERQAKADIYFLGVNIYTMVFSQLFESFNGGKVLNNLINIKKRSGFSSKLLDLMSRCLEKDSHVRVSLEEVVKILSDIERQFYFKSSYKRVYLGPEPLNLYSFSSNQVQDRAKTEKICFEPEESNNRQDMDRTIDAVIKKTTLQRNTGMYENLFRKMMVDLEMDEIWTNSERSKLVQLNQQILMHKIDTFLERLQIKAYYYELAYRILCEVNLTNVNSIIHFENIRSHLQLFSSELVVILSFIYGTIIKFSFMSDPYYDELNSSYEIRQAVENIKVFHSRWQFFSGRQNLHVEANKQKKQMKEQLNELRQSSGQNYKDLDFIAETFKFSFEGVQIVESLIRMVEDFSSKAYDKQKQRFSFQTEERYIMKYLQKMESIVKKEMIQTIISLILAYEKIKMEPWGHLSNLKNAIFMLMILQAQNTKIVEKNDMVIIKEELTTMIDMNLGWKSEELEAFFNNYTHTHTEEVIKGLCQLESQAIITTEDNEKEESEDICIQINGFQKVGISVQEIEKKVPNIELVQEKNQSYVQVQEEKLNEKENPLEEELQEKNDKVVEVSPQIEESRMKETFDYQLSQGEIRRTINSDKRDAKLPHPGLVLVQYYD